MVFQKMFDFIWENRKITAIFIVKLIINCEVGRARSIYFIFKNVKIAMKYQPNCFGNKNDIRLYMY